MARPRAISPVRSRLPSSTTITSKFSATRGHSAIHDRTTRSTLPSSLCDGRKTLIPGIRAGAFTMAVWELIANLAITAAEEQQRFAFVRSFGLLDLAEINRMVAAVDRGRHFAFEVGERAVEDRSAVRADLVADALELLAATNRKLARQRFLVGREYINGKDFALLETRIAVGF